MMVLYKLEYDSPIGRLTLLSSDKGICLIKFPKESAGRLNKFILRNFPDAEIKPGGKYNREAVKQLKAYFGGRLKKFTVKLDILSEGFRKDVLKKVRAIPYGKTRTYGEIAAMLNKPQASRAVGGANGSNPIPIIIPCHRVVAATGLGGFGGGLPLKKKLHTMEGINLS